MTNVPHAQPRYRGAHPKRRGTIYLAVLVVGGAVLTLSLCGMALRRQSLETANLQRDTADARVAVRAAIETALGRIADDPVWRYHASSIELTNFAGLNGAVVNLTITDDADGDLLDDVEERATIRAEAQVGDARQTLAVDITGGSLTSPLLSKSMWSGDDIIINSSTRITNQRPIGANDNVYSTSALTDGPVEAADSVNGEYFSGGVTSDVDAISIPNYNDIVDYYVDNGTWINRDDLIHTGGGGRLLERVVLSPNSNPFGATNPEGIYLIHVSGRELTIQNVRIVGTLVITSANKVTVTGSVRMDPAVDGYPSLLCKTNVVLNHTGDALNEYNVGVNFNPVGTPWMGEVDDQFGDVYPCSITGIIYTSEALTLSLQAATVEAPIIARKDITVPSGYWAFLLEHHADATAPPGWTGVSVETSIVRNSWRYITN